MSVEITIIVVLVAYGAYQRLMRYLVTRLHQADKEYITELKRAVELREDLIEVLDNKHEMNLLLIDALSAKLMDVQTFDALNESPFAQHRTN